MRQRVLAFVMAGGRGERLDPLTRYRTKPAVPFGGRYRLIDFVLSNLVNSDITAIYVLTQYKAQSVLEHLQSAWTHRVIGRESFITAVPAQMQTGDSWYRGTADAVHQNLNRLREFRPDVVAVFGADHIYKMNVRQMIDAHLASGAKATVACLRVPRHEATAFGVAHVDASNRIRAFVEKPADPPAVPDDPDSAFASMGNYIFDTGALIDLLEYDAPRPDSAHDFGRDLIPRLVEAGVAYADDFSQNLIPGSEAGERGYWRDVGTIDSYFEANLDLKNVAPQLNLYNRDWPIHSVAYGDPPAKFVFDEPGRRGVAIQSVVSPGCILAGGFAKDCVLGRNVVLHTGAEVHESILMDHVDIGRDAHVRRAIIDKNVRIPAGARVGFGDPIDRELGVVTPSGIVVVPKAEVGLDGLRLG
ncbi:MAG: glucose-1-phosphate adenylyltransferase [Vicinamibacterales bacterium]